MSRHRCCFPRTSELLIALLLLTIVSPIRAQVPSFQVIVHPANLATEISAQKASRIFLSKITRWPSGVSITPYDLAPESPVRAAFSREIHGRSTLAVSSYWQRMVFGGEGAPPKQMSPSDVVDAVRVTPGAIAYVRADLALPSGVKRLSIIGEYAQAGAGRESHAGSEPSVPEGALLALAVSPASPDTVWASFQGHGLWTSADGGGTWAPVPDSPELVLPALALDRVDPQLLMAGGENGLYRSLDLGNQWRRVAGDGSYQPRAIRGITSLPQSPGTFFVHTHGGGLLRSDDSGTTFSRLRVPSPVRAFTIDPITGDLWMATSRSVQVSQDRGESWTSRLDLSGRSVSGPILVAHLAGVKTLWVASSRNLLRAELDDEAGTLQPSLKQAVQRLYVLEDTIYAATGRGVYELAADGLSWEHVSSISGAVLAADPYGSGRVYAGNPEGRIWRRDHSADAWREVFHIWNRRPPPATMDVLAEPSEGRSPVPPSVPLRLRCAPVPGHVAALAVHPHARGGLWAATEHGVFRSDDGGRSWGPPGRGLTITDVHSLSVDPKTPATLWAGTHGGGVYVSRDGGASWTSALAAVDARTQGLRSVVVHEVAVDPSVPALVYAATPGGVFASRDRGAHWRTLRALSERGNPLHVDDPGWQIAPRALAVGPDSLHPMTLTGELGRLFDVNAVPATRQMRPGQVTMPYQRFSRNVCAEAGRSIPRDLRVRLRRELALRDLTFADDPDGSRVPWVATAFGVWRGAQDHDASWTRLPLDTNVAVVAVDPRRPDRVYAAAVDGLWRSGDAGVTWERWGLDEAVFSLALDAGPSELVYAGLAGGRIAVVREGLSGEEPEVTSVTVPSRLEGAVDRARLRGISSVVHRHLDEPPEDQGSAFRRAAGSTPRTASRLRALYAAEGLSRVSSGDSRDRLRGLLIASLQQIRSDGLSHGREMPVTVDLSPGGDWLVSEWRFDDGLRSHSELRLYAPGEQGWGGTSGAVSHLRPSGATWMSLHDLALEPPHLRPAWLLEDPGPRLAWSDGRALLATHGGPDRILVWNLPSQAPEEMARLPGPRVVHLDRGQDPRGARTALSDSGGWMAVARHGGDRHTATAVLRLWRLGSHAERRTLDRVTRPRSDPSPYFTKLVFTGDERYLLGFRADGSGQIWRVDLEGDVETEALPGHRFKAVTRGPGGNWLATVAGGRHSSELQLWPLRDPGRFTSISLTSSTVVSQVSFHHGESWLSAITDGTAHLWDLLERPSTSARRESPEEPPEVTLVATASAACASVFDPGGDWLTHQRTASKLWKLRVRGADGRLVRSRQPSSRRVSDGGTCRGLPGSARRVGALAIERGASRETLSLWDLSGPELRHLSGQVQRLGPADLHHDEGALRAPDQLLALWPGKPLKEVSDGALRALACKVVGRPLSPQEWSFVMGTAEVRPLCPPLPER